MTVIDWPPVGSGVAYRGNVWLVTGWYVAGFDTRYVLIKRADGGGDGSIRLDCWDEMTSSL